MVGPHNVCLFFPLKAPIAHQFNMLVFSCVVFNVICPTFLFVFPLNSYLWCGSGTALWNVRYAPKHVINQCIYIKSHNRIHIKTEAFVVCCPPGGRLRAGFQSHIVQPLRVEKLKMVSGARAWSSEKRAMCVALVLTLTQRSVKFIWVGW